MQNRLVRNGPERTWALAFDTGDLVVEGLERFAREHDLDGAHFTGIGALSECGAPVAGADIGAVRRGFFDSAPGYRPGLRSE